MRRLLTAGLVAAAAVLGTWGAVAAAQATTAASASVAPAAPLSHFLPGSTPGPVLAARPVAYPAGVTAPAVTSPYDEFYGVSCVHPGDCLAVGLNANLGGGDGSPLAYLWNGHAWKATAVHLPSGATGGVLGSVSCKAGGCVAVGEYYRGKTSSFPFALYWNGSKWTASPQPPTPSGARLTFLEWVSCRSAQDCVAAGSYSTSSTNEIALAETWNGHAWTAHRVPAPAGKIVFANADAVSCPVAAFCLLGGFYANSSGRSALLAVRWDGVHFGLVSLPAPATASNFDNLISGVSCTSSTSCAVDGLASEQLSTTSFTSRGFAEVLTGSAWKLFTPPWPKGQQSELISVSCASASFCVGAGGVGPYSVSNTGGRAAVVTYNGSAWTLTEFATPSGIGSGLQAVQCLTTTYCVVAGTEGKYNSTASAHGLTGFYNGAAWTLVATP